MEKKTSRMGDVLLLIIAALFLTGITLAFHACDPMEDGSFMTCHWAGEAEKGLAVCILVIAALHFLIRDTRIKAGLDIAIFPLCAFAAVIPGVLIPLCMMQTMRCHTTMRPGVLLFAVLIAVVAASDLVMRRREMAA